MHQIKSNYETLHVYWQLGIACSRFCLIKACGISHCVHCVPFNLAFARLSKVKVLAMRKVTNSEVECNFGRAVSERLLGTQTDYIQYI